MQPGVYLVDPTHTSGIVNSVTGNIVSNADPANPVITQVQSDWTEADNTQPDYIKNKPTIPSATTANSGAHISAGANVQHGATAKTLQPLLQKTFLNAAGFEYVITALVNAIANSEVFHITAGDIGLGDLDAVHKQVRLQISNTSNFFKLIGGLGGNVSLHADYQNLNYKFGQTTNNGSFNYIEVDATNGVIKFWGVDGLGAAKLHSSLDCVTGQWTFSDYGVGTLTGTPTYALSVDANGKIIETQSIVSFKQSLTALQCATLNTVPVDITDLPAPGAGYAWEVLSMSVKFTFVTTAYDFGQMQINAETSNINGFQFLNTNYQGIGTASVWTQGTTGAGAKTCFIENKKMQLTADADDGAGGDGTFVVYGTARKIKL